MRRLLVTLLLIGGLLVGVDLFAKSFASERIAEQVKANVGLRREPGVELGGFPFVTQVAAGELESVSLSLEDLSRQGVRLTSLSVTLDRVRFSLGNLLDQNAERLRAASASGRADLDQGDLDAALLSAGVPFRVRFDQGRLIADAAGEQEEVDVRIEGGELVLSVPSLGETAVSLPRPIDGITYDSVEVFPGRLVLRFGSGPVTVRAPR